MLEPGQLHHRRLDDAELQRRHLAGDRRAHAELVERYLPLVRSLARRYRNRGEPLDDLVQVASLGLIKALQRWDPQRGFALSTYVVPVVLGELRRHFRDHAWAIKPPRATQELVLAVVAARRRLLENGSAAASAAEIGAAIGRSEDDVRDALTALAARFAQSLDAQVIDGGALDASYADVERALLVDGLLAILDDRARQVLMLAFREDLLQREVAQRVGCSQVHVSRIIRDSLNRMRLHAGVLGFAN
jgi:RNA polymerase sigma-B factor